MLAVIPVRDGVLPAGADEVVAECGGRALLAGSAPNAGELAGDATDITLVELGDFAPARWAAAIGRLVAELDGGGGDVLVLPASPDGRDLAPRVAHALRRPLHAGAVLVTPTSARVVRGGGLELHDIAIDGPAVVTFQPGVRGVDAPTADGPECFVRDVPPPNTRAAGNTRVSDDARVVEVLPPDVATMDLGEAQRIVAGGAGLESPERFTQLADVAAAVGASVGATRVITDRGWVDHDRQIGTTGVVVAPRLYVALGISGAVQHTAGLGDPDHIVSVNTDAHCPMMQLADLAVVSDANAVLDELQRALAGDA